ncbi:hypothetical protein C8R44DRAFT_628262 [Mycena epipterygia]|nr:hypothetical protein C8R44DRAFT_628262 [Mycena epipterygia]
MACRFPLRMPVDQPPMLLGELANGRRTPSYALAWVCPPNKFYKNLERDMPKKVNDRNYRNAIAEKWRPLPGWSFNLHPMPYLAMDENYYLIIIYNERYADHLQRVLDVKNDPVIQAARVAMGVDQDPLIEETLQWLRYPINWVVAEARQTRARSRLLNLPSELDATSASEDLPTSPKVSIY